MSGFEVAGIVLGSIPLVISTLEHYKNGAQIIRRWMKYDRELQSLIRNLETERVKLQNVCEKLLQGLVPPSQIDAMVENPFGELWQKEEIQKKVKLRLWRSWTVFENIVKDMQMAIEAMSGRLGSHDTRQDSVSTLRELKKASFTLSRSSYADILTTLREGLSSLESLTTMNIDLEPQRKVRSQIKLFNILRNLSFSIYRAIVSSLTCKCQHDVSMRLSTWSDSASVTPVDEEEVVAQDLKFHLALSSEKQKSWEELFVQAVPPHRSENNSIAPAKPPSKRSVKFAAFPSSSNSSSTPTLCSASELSTSSSSTTVLQATSSTPYHAKIPASLCAASISTQTSENSGKRGIILDRSSPMNRQFSVFAPSGKEVMERGMVSLRDVLEGNNNLRPLEYRQRLQLAVFIASSVLQLYKTPWLPTIPTSHNIFFIRREHHFTYEHAFVVAQEKNSNNEMPLQIIRSPTLIALGVLLIELLRGQTIDSLRRPDESMGSSPNLLADYVTAHRLLGEVSQSSSNYGSAVRRCINGEFQRKNLDLEDEDFRQEVYCGVVALLEEDLRSI